MPLMTDKDIFEALLVFVRKRLKPRTTKPSKFAAECCSINYPIEPEVGVAYEFGPPGKKQIGVYTEDGFAIATDEMLMNVICAVFVDQAIYQHFVRGDYKEASTTDGFMSLLKDYVPEGHYRTHEGEIKPYPPTATHLSRHPKGSIALFYRVQEKKDIDGNPFTSIEYLSSWDIWMGTSERRPYDDFLKTLEPLVRP